MENYIAGQPQEFKALGKRITYPVAQLDTFPAPPDLRVVSQETEEGTSLCPVTHQPDQWGLRLEYAPDKLCLESKSLKLYLWTFRERGLFCERLASEVAHAVHDVLDPFWTSVTVTFRPRGGIVIESVAFVPREADK